MLGLLHARGRLGVTTAESLGLERRQRLTTPEELRGFGQFAQDLPRGGIPFVDSLLLALGIGNDLGLTARPVKI